MTPLCGSHFLPLRVCTVLQGEQNRRKQKESSSLKDTDTSPGCKMLFNPGDHSGQCSSQGLTSSVLTHCQLERQSERLGRRWGDALHYEWCSQYFKQRYIHREKYSFYGSFPRLQSDQHPSVTNTHLSLTSYDRWFCRWQIFQMPSLFLIRFWRKCGSINNIQPNFPRFFVFVSSLQQMSLFHYYFFFFFFLFQFQMVTEMQEYYILFLQCSKFKFNSP